MNHLTQAANVPGLSDGTRSWFRSILFLGSAVAASLTFVLAFRFEHPTRALLILSSIAAALLIAIGLHIGSLVPLRKRSQNAVIALDEVDRELQSVLEHALQAIVMLDYHFPHLHVTL